MNSVLAYVHRDWAGRAEIATGQISGQTTKVENIIPRFRLRGAYSTGA